MSSPIPHGTGIQCAAEQFPTGRWPDQIAYSHRNVYLYSVNPSPQIEALSHVHVFNYDLDVSAPYSMTVNLPVMNNLPSKARFYFFYVSRCHNGDTLSFSPVSLSGDTINGIAGPSSFTLTGTKILFVCVGVSQNYIIHPIPATIPSSVSSYANPTVMFRAVNHDGAMDPTFQFTSPVEDAGYVTARYTSYTWNPTPDPDMYIAGMDGYISYQKPIASLGVAGFVCNHPGIYRITYSTSGILVVPNSGPLLSIAGNGMLAVLSSGGGSSPIDYASFGAQTVSLAVPNGTMRSGSCTREFRLLAGFVIVGSVSIDATTAAGGLGQWGGRDDLSTMTFELIKDLAPPPAPLALGLRSFGPAAAGLSAPPSASLAPAVGPNEIVMGSKSDNAASRLALHKQQVQSAKDTAARNDSSSSSSSAYPAGLTLNSSGGTQIGLGDLESIVRQIMRVQASQPQQPAASTFTTPDVVISSSSSASSSSSSSSSNAAGKKRVREDSSWIEPPAKK